MIVGFSGSSEVVTEIQEQRLASLLISLDVREAHHGDCIIADALFHILVCTFTDARLVLHPPKNPAKRAFMPLRRIMGDEIREEAEYLVRNKHIGDDVELLIAVSDTMEEINRSGTWATVRYVRDKLKKPVVVILPDGTFVCSNMNE